MNNRCFFTTKSFSPWVFLAVSFVSTANTNTDASAATVQSKSELIQGASIIAVVDIESVDKVSEHDNVPANFVFKYVARANPKTIIWGHPSYAGFLWIYSMDNRFGANLKDLRRGETLAFLTYDKGQLTSSGGDLSLSHIENGKVAWFKDEQTIALRSFKIDDVVADIQNRLPRSMPLSEPLQILVGAVSLDAKHVDNSMHTSTYWLQYQATLAKVHEPLELQYVIKTGSPAGQLYGALLL
jgi:hypothetical protein